jgi:hypothetical protein
MRRTKKGEAAASPLFGAVKLLVNSQPAISERSEYSPVGSESQLPTPYDAAIIFLQQGNGACGDLGWTLGPTALAGAL